MPVGIWGFRFPSFARAAGGLALGSTLAQPSFRLGGSFGENPAILFPDEYYPLRGFPVSSSSGEAFAMGTLEYRFPLWHVNRGLGTWPVFLRALSAAAFADAGQASDVPAFDRLNDKNLWQSGVQGFKLGVGAELHAHLVVSYGLSLTVRTGLGMSPLGGGYPPGDLRGWYLQIGSYF